MQALRKQDLFKSPGVAETLDWAGALSELDVVALDPATVSDTLGVLLKYQDDIAKLEGSQGQGAARRGEVGAAGGGITPSFRDSEKLLGPDFAAQNERQRCAA